MEKFYWQDLFKYFSISKTSKEMVVLGLGKFEVGQDIETFDRLLYCFYMVLLIAYIKVTNYADTNPELFN